MFLGHYAVGYAAKRAAPRTSLGTLFAAAVLLDLLWPVFLLAGWERVLVRPTAGSPFLGLDFVSYPISHSAAAALGWAVLAAVLYGLVRGYRRGAVVVGLAVFSHWALDFVVHVPDLPVWPGGPKVGAGLWTHPVWTVVVEVGMFLVGWGIYLATTRAADGVGRHAGWTLAATLLLVYAASLLAPPAPGTSAEAIAIVGFAAWLFVLWAAWADRHRLAKSAPPC